MIRIPFKTEQKKAYKGKQRSKKFPGLPRLPGNVCTIRELECFLQDLRRKMGSEPALAHLETALGMARAGPTLVTPTPPGPSQHPRGRGGDRPDQSSEQTTH